MREISLTQDKVALVDDEDFERLNQFKWYAHRQRGGKFYAGRTVHTGHGRGGPHYMLHMHRFLLGLAKNQQGGHRDGNGLNNQKYNLRPCSDGQNAKNRRKRSDSASPFKGVTWNTKAHKWYASIHGEGKRWHLGSFPDPVSAAKAYNNAARNLHGEFASLNTIPD